MKKSLIVLAAISMIALMFTGCPGSTEPAPQTSDPATTKPEEKPAAETVIFSAKDIAAFKCKLPSNVAANKKITVKAKGTNNGKTGFRIYAIYDVDSNKSDINTNFKEAGLPSGAFDISGDVTTTAEVNYILIKGPAYGTNIDNIDFTKITVTIDDKETVLTAADISAL